MVNKILIFYTIATICIATVFGIIIILDECLPHALDGLEHVDCKEYEDPNKLAGAICISTSYAAGEAPDDYGKVYMIMNEDGSTSTAVRGGMDIILPNTDIMIHVTDDLECKIIYPDRVTKEE